VRVGTYGASKVNLRLKKMNFWPSQRSVSLPVDPWNHPWSIP